MSLLGFSKAFAEKELVEQVEVYVVDVRQARRIQVISVFFDSEKFHKYCPFTLSSFFVFYRKKWKKP